MDDRQSKSAGFRGSTTTPLEWEGVIAIFDEIFGADKHHLPAFLTESNHVTGTWQDGDGIDHVADTLEDMEVEYRAERSAVLSFGNLRCSLTYYPGPPRPRFSAILKGPAERVDRWLSVLESAFPDAFDGAVLFLSWSGRHSREIAARLRPMLARRLPGVEVFYSETSIDPGDDPDRRMVEEGLLRAQVVVAILTQESAAQPWVIWETATAWAREQTVIPVFVDVEPRDMKSNPLPIKCEGVHLSNRDRMNRALAVITERFGVASSADLTDEEWTTLQDGVQP